LTKIGIRDLIKAGVHFGHRTSRWNPDMEPYILKKRNLIHLIDLRETIRGLVTGAKLASIVSGRGGYVLFGGTKRQARPIVRREAQRCGMPYVADRWPGGLLTNYVTIRDRLERLIELEQLEESGEIESYGKKMISSLRREKRKIERNLGGVRDMDRLPGLVVLVDPVREYIAADEARKLGIPSVALIDTDGAPDAVDVVVPGNDDSIGSIEIFLHTMADAVLEGKGRTGTAQAASEATRTAAGAESEAQQAGEVAEGEESAQAAATKEAEESSQEPVAPQQNSKEEAPQGAGG